MEYGYIEIWMSAYFSHQIDYIVIFRLWHRSIQLYEVNIILLDLCWENWSTTIAKKQDAGVYVMN